MLSPKISLLNLAPRVSSNTISHEKHGMVLVPMALLVQVYGVLTHLYLAVVCCDV